MSPIEHYFENLLTIGSDIKGEPNKNALSKEVQKAIEICADYIKNIQLYNNVISDDSKVNVEYEEATTKNDSIYNLCDSRAIIGCAFQSDIIRKKCAFHMPPHIEPDNCGNHVVMHPTVEAIPKVDYKNRLKADMVAMLEDLDLQIDEVAAYYLKVAKVQRLIRDQINALKGE